eukprot:UN29500
MFGNTLSTDESPLSERKTNRRRNSRPKKEIHYKSNRKTKLKPEKIRIGRSESDDEKKEVEAVQIKSKYLYGHKKNKSSKFGRSHSISAITKSLGTSSKHPLKELRSHSISTIRIINEEHQTTEQIICTPTVYTDDHDNVQERIQETRKAWKINDSPAENGDADIFNSEGFLDSEDEQADAEDDEHSKYLEITDNFVEMLKQKKKNKRDAKNEVLQDTLTSPSYKQVVDSPHTDFDIGSRSDPEYDTIFADSSSSEEQSWDVQLHRDSSVKAAEENQIKNNNHNNNSLIIYKFKVRIN